MATVPARIGDLFHGTGNGHRRRLGIRRNLSPSGSDRRPRYTGDGKLELPGGYRTWIFVGANLSPDTGPQADPAPPAPPAEVRKARPDDQFHHIYINPESYDAYRKTGKFPDPTMLVLEIFRAETRDPKGILSGGQVEGRRGRALGGGQGCRPARWRSALGVLLLRRAGNDKPVKPAPVHADKDCYACHLQHASNDNVWVQFLPGAPRSRVTDDRFRGGPAEPRGRSRTCRSRPALPCRSRRPCRARSA